MLHHLFRMLIRLLSLYPLFCFFIKGQKTKGLAVRTWCTGQKHKTVLYFSFYEDNRVSGELQK